MVDPFETFLNVRLNSELQKIFFYSLLKMTLIGLMSKEERKRGGERERRTEAERERRTEGERDKGRWRAKDREREKEREGKREREREKDRERERRTEGREIWADGDRRTGA
jgi:hypothetical protein